MKYFYILFQFCFKKIIKIKEFENTEIVNFNNI